jgi:ACR3 family arsenite efflux pump ArsB
MMYPILCKVRYESLHEILGHRSIWTQIFFSIFLNWVVAPFLMVGFELSPPPPSMNTVVTDERDM